MMKPGMTNLTLGVHDFFGAGQKVIAQLIHGAHRVDPVAFDRDVTVRDDRPGNHRWLAGHNHCVLDN